ncbi:MULTISPECIES: polyphosphate kinase 2 [unclassified Paracoccus (in: a-proteobacteria)]|uniref:polyphosphate kinase 2 n=1 Tax=unclassified Paracoccus (in: a-proteobacteria) TaxID=2688777 RepID=UPI001602D5CD|nr:MULTISPECIES: polyphosphate kinase 2 [unclassified Paracoccus (in: a-proteobacteria)]MBB1491379.1 polyphosphate kinase 2 [Paracoccus sp. MC1854]MBB1498625.1 polyphosphate kinase 2 [Paracoccus sp. MC1862]QQO46138.1 polyphosphate kinase 2 [Paracoccus sp. MC1862]
MKKKPAPSQENPLVGQISRYFRDEAPAAIRRAIEKADADDILDPSYPYRDEMSRRDYEDRAEALQVQMVTMLGDVIASGKRVVVLFEGRDAAGKGGTIDVMRENLNPRSAHVVALPRPTEREAGQWYFQRYVARLPAAGEIALFDRSWYNRGAVERVFGFASESQRAQFFRQLPDFEKLLVDDGIILVKLWLNVGRAEQLRRFLDREKDPLKRWKLSAIDVDGLGRWDDYTAAIGETLSLSHTPVAPWTVIRSDDKRRARIAAMQAVLGRVDYAGKDHALIGAPDPLIAGGPEMLRR